MVKPIQAKQRDVASRQESLWRKMKRLCSGTCLEGRSSDDLPCAYRKSIPIWGVIALFNVRSNGYLCIRPKQTLLLEEE